MSRLIVCSLILAPLLACSGDKSGDDTDTSGGGGLLDDSGGGGATLDCDDPEIPCVEEVVAYCYENTTGASTFFWKVDIKADDPQGSDTLDGGEVVATKNDSIVHSAPVVCSEGDCFASWNIVTADKPMDCSSSTAANYTFSVTVEDEDGNTSLPASTTGFVGAGR